MKPMFFAGSKPVSMSSTSVHAGKKASLGLRAGLSAALAAGSVAPAFAEGGANAGSVLQSLNSQIGAGGKVTLNIATLLGIGYAIAGGLELKRSQDPNNQGRDSAKSAGVKIGVGGGLAAITQIINIASSTVTNGSGSANVTQGTANFGS